MSYQSTKLANFGLGYASLATVGYSLINADGTVNLARTTVGVAELPAGSGSYRVLATIPDGFVGYIQWDTGGTTPAYASEPVDDVTVKLAQILSNPGTGTLGAALTSAQAFGVARAAVSPTSAGGTFIIGQGDTLPVRALTLVDETGAVVNLTGATVKYRMWIPGQPDKIHNAAATIIDALAGKVEYAWRPPGDTAAPGEYHDCMVVTFADGSVETFPNEPKMSVTIAPSND